MFEGSKISWFYAPDRLSMDWHKYCCSNSVELNNALCFPSSVYDGICQKASPSFLPLCWRLSVDCGCAAVWLLDNCQFAMSALVSVSKACMGFSLAHRPFPSSVDLLPWLRRLSYLICCAHFSLIRTAICIILF